MISVDDEETLRFALHFNECIALSFILRRSADHSNFFREEPAVVEDVSVLSLGSFVPSVYQSVGNDSHRNCNHCGHLNPRHTGVLQEMWMSLAYTNSAPWDVELRVVKDTTMRRTQSRFWVCLWHERKHRPCYSFILWLRLPDIAFESAKAIHW